MQTVFLKTGESIVTAEDLKVIVILGSCVAIMLYDPVTRIGAMSHALLPDSGYSSSQDKNQKPTHYVEEGFYNLLSRFEERGIKKWRLEVKLFGGAKVTFCDQDVQKCTNIGEKNYLKALEIVEREGLKLTVKDLGGNRGRKLVFYPNQGIVYRKFVNDGSAVNIVKEEEKRDVKNTCVSCRRFREHPANP